MSKRETTVKSRMRKMRVRELKIHAAGLDVSPSRDCEVEVDEPIG